MPLDHVQRAQIISLAFPEIWDQFIRNFHPRGDLSEPSILNDWPIQIKPMGPNLEMDFCFREFGVWGNWSKVGPTNVFV